MYQTLIFCHSIVRWLVLASLVFSIIRTYIGWRKGSDFTVKDNAVRHWTATIAHIQLMIGILLYTNSPAVRYFWTHPGAPVSQPDLSFFPVIHLLLMLTAIVLITIGSALAKRRPSDAAKFRTLLAWYTAALILIFIAIPWPFSPFTARPYFR